MSHIVATKIAAPSPHGYALTRPRLMSAMEQSTAEHRVTLVRAPAGFGKSTLCAQFLAAYDGPFLWLSFDHFDTAEVVVRHRGAAVKVLDPTAGEMASEVDFLAWLSKRAQPLLLVFDDFHLLEDAGAIRLLNDVVRRAPASARLVVATRKASALSPGGWGEESMLELGPAELRFDRDELRQVVETLCPSASGELDKLWQWTEGWPAAVLILAQGLKRGKVLDSILPTGSPTALMSALLEEVLASHSEGERDSLFTMALLERFTPELSARLCNGPLPWDWRESWFVVELEDGWFRFHHLLAEFLREKASLLWPPELYDRVHQQATRWFEDRGHIDEAIQHALLGQEWSRAGRLLKEGKSLGEMLNFYRRSAEWLQALPGQEVDKVLTSRLGVVLWSSFRFEEAYQAFKRGLGSGMAEVEFLCLAGLTSCSDSMNLTQKRRDWYGKALAAVPEARSHARTIGLYVLATVAVMHYGDAFLADRLTEGGESSRPLPDSEFPIFFAGVPGTVAMMRGGLEESCRSWDSLQERARSLSNQNVQMIAWGMWACCHYEMGALEQAMSCWQHVLDGSPLPHVAPLKDTFWPRYVGTLRALGLNQELERALSGGSPLQVESTPVTRWVRVRQLVEEGRSEEAATVLGAPPEMDDESYDYYEQPLYWGWIAVWSAAHPGSERDRALRWLDVIERKAVLAGRVRDQLEVRLGRACLWFLDKREEEAMAELRAALAQGRPSGYVAVYLEQPVEIRRLCLEIDPSLARASAQWRLLSSLSPREHQILDLIRNGASNRQIAEECFLSLHTVKWHNQRIFKKLGVKSRAEALLLPCQ